MGKRASAKPKAKAGAPAAGAPAKKAKTAASKSEPPPAAPASWGRQEPPAIDAKADALVFFLVDIENGGGGNEDELRLYGVTAAGASVCARLRGFRPYLYLRCPPEFGDREESLRKALDTVVQTALPANAKGSGAAVLKVEKLRRTPVLIFQPEDDFLRITVAGPRIMGPCAKALEQGLRIPAGEAGLDAFDVQGSSTFEANVPVVLRFLVDSDLGGGRWLELLPGTYDMKPVNDKQDRSSMAQVEVEVDLSPDRQTVKAISVDTDLGSSMPPVRIASLEVLVDADSRLTAAACVLAVHGEKRKSAQAIWVRRELQNQGSDIVMTDYDPDADETPKVFLSESEDVLVEHIGETLALLDADILLTYDASRTYRGLLGKKGVAKSGAAIVRGISRRIASEIKFTAKSNELSGFSGRLSFDLQKQVEKDHKLVDYSLGALSEHFCKVPLPELSEAVLSKFLVDQPQTLAQHVLRQACASYRIFDQLAYLYNFVEMARVTGVPLVYLLDRGQAVKVQAQLLWEGRKRGYILPSQRPGTGEETSFEGATVLDPACGFYRAPVAVLDFASLYPSIMLAHNLCYSTLLVAGREKRPDCPEHAVAPATKGTEDSDTQSCFVATSVRRGLLPSILERLLSARKAAKKQLGACGPQDETMRKVLHGRQLALKLSANSVYGFTGAMNGPLPCLELAGSVTAYGREMIQATKRKVESHFVQSNGYAHDAEVIYGDTDSVMVKFGPDDLSLEDATKLSAEASEVCSAVFPPPVRLEFEKVYRPFLLMAKKRYAGLAWTSPTGNPNMETKGIETVRRDWSDLVRQGLEQTLQLLLRKENDEGSIEAATTYVRGLCSELRQNRVDFRSLIISKSLGREEYASRTPHLEVMEKMKKRDPSTAPRFGDRVAYLVLAGTAKAKVYERAEDPLYALEHDLPIDADYYLENQLKQPLIRVFEQVYDGKTEKAEQTLFGSGGPGAAPKQVVAAPSSMGLGGMGKFMKAKPKCLDCNKTTAKDGQPFCDECTAKGPDKEREVREQCIAKAQKLRTEYQELRNHCDSKCAAPPGSFHELPSSEAAPLAAATAARETCANLNCQVIFRRVRAAKELRSATDALARLKVTDW